MQIMSYASTHDTGEGLTRREKRRRSPQHSTIHIHPPRGADPGALPSDAARVHDDLGVGERAAGEGRCERGVEGGLLRGGHGSEMWVEER